MTTTNLMTNCSKCQKKTLHIEQKINHILHVLLTVVTAGFWIVAWIYIALSHNKKTQCTICGHDKKFIEDYLSENKNSKDGSSGIMVIFALLFIVIAAFMIHLMD